jgi:hypothetical protein
MTGTEDYIMVERFNKLPLVGAVAAVVMVTSVVAMASAAAPDPTPAQTPVQSQPQQVTPAAAEQQTEAVSQLSAEQVQMQKAAVVAAAGRSAMQHIGVAGKLLADGDAEQAKEVLQAGSDILGQLATVYTEEGKSADDQRMVPVYARLGIVEGVEVSDEMKQGLNELAPLVASSQHARVVERLKSFGVGLSYSFVELPLDKVSEQVSSALEALNSGDNDGAAKFIAAASDATVMETVNVGFETDAPQSAAPGETATADHS